MTNQYQQYPLRSTNKNTHDFILNIAATSQGTRTLGPSIRAALCVQGCLQAGSLTVFVQAMRQHLPELGDYHWFQSERRTT